jgi:hypothetical protein
VVESSQSSGDNDDASVFELFPAPGLPGDTSVESHILDIPAVRDEDSRNPLLYVAVANEDSTVAFIGATVWESDDSISYNFSTQVNRDHTIGYADTVLSAGRSEATFEDFYTVDVVVPYGTLESVTDDEIVLSRKNMAILGDEIIFFGTVQDLGSKTWRLSHLIRGYRDTKDEWGTHAVGERFVLLDSSIGVVPLLFSDRGRTKYYSVSSSNSTSDEGHVHQRLIKMAVVRPFTPGDLAGTRDGSNNLTITWKRRSRSMGSEFQDGGVPNVDDREEYDVVILDGPGGNELRTERIVDATSYIYTAANQTADGLTPGDPVDVTIAQIGFKYNGPGKVATAEL